MSRRELGDRQALDIVSRLLQERPADMVERIAAVVHGTGRVVAEYDNGAVSADRGLGLVGTLTTTIDGITYTATRSRGLSMRPYWTIRTSDRELAEPGYDNDWYEPTEACVREAIARVAATRRAALVDGGAQ